MTLRLVKDNIILVLRVEMLSSVCLWPLALIGIGIKFLNYYIDFRVIKNIMVFRVLNWAWSNASGSMLCQEWGLSSIRAIALVNYVVKA